MNLPCIYQSGICFHQQPEALPACRGSAQSKGMGHSGYMSLGCRAVRHSLWGPFSHICFLYRSPGWGLRDQRVGSPKGWFSGVPTEQRQDDPWTPLSGSPDFCPLTPGSREQKLSIQCSQMSLRPRVFNTDTSYLSGRRLSIKIGLEVSHYLFSSLIFLGGDFYYILCFCCFRGDLAWHFQKQGVPNSKVKPRCPSMRDHLHQTWRHSWSESRSCSLTG